MRSRRAVWVPAWMGALAAFGTIVGHVIAYFVLAPDDHARAELLRDTGHGPWVLVTPFALGALVAGMFGWIRRQLHEAPEIGGRRAALLYAISRLGLVQCCGFLVLEVTERALSGHSVHVDELPIVLTGLVVQVLIAVALGLVLVAVGDLVERLFRSNPAQEPASPACVLYADLFRASRSLARGPRTLRGPPASRARPTFLPT